MSARFSSEKAVEKIGNRYNLVLVASIRTRELKQGHRAKINTEFGAVLTALTEIEEDKITADYLKRLRK